MCTFEKAIKIFQKVKADVQKGALSFIEDFTIILGRVCIRVLGTYMLLESSWAPLIFSL